MPLIKKESIGAHLVGMPPHTARGLHNLFNHLFDEIERLKGGKQEPALEVTGDVLPPVVEPIPPPAGSELIVPPTDSASDVLPAETGTFDAGASNVAGATDAPADLPPAA